MILRYNYDKSVGLVTVASAFNQNLAILDVNEHLNADSLAVAHDGFINIIPIINSKRHAKYVPIHDGVQRGSGFVKAIKWLQFKGETLFFVLSTAGLQIYDAEITELRFFYSCQELGGGGDQAYMIGVCAIENKHLCVGTSLGSVLVFSSNEGNTKFLLVNQVDNAHPEPITLMDSYDNNFVSCSKGTTLFWKVKYDNFEVKRRIEIWGLTPTALHVSGGLALLGCESGELSVFDVFSEKLFIREVAHRLRISSVDFASLKYYILTASIDGCVKVWNFDQYDRRVSCLFTLNCKMAVCGVGFLNYSCTEFCVVKENNLKVDFYIEEHTKE